MKRATTYRSNVLAALVAVAGVASASCGPEDVVVASTIASFDGGPGGSCARNADCLPNEFCSMASCRDSSGTCAKRPMFCDNNLMPVCGCDGVVYWNQCLRQQDGVASDEAGECSLGYAACGGLAMPQCPSNAVCNRLVPGAGNGCSLTSVGACWALPGVCPADSGVPPLQSCGPGPATCTDACTAIRSGMPYQMGGCP